MGSSNSEKYLGLPNMVGRGKRLVFQSITTSVGFVGVNGLDYVILKKMVGWQLLCYSNSLFSRTLKAKYYLNSDFLSASLGTYPSYT
ncbi:reverse transcriptase [Gossypium australe]|uniref:Reverse transcriptase n=1 Tax=Gossypium australe TaxID=47621 RepID=A0A5B6UW58_9ROSI|nr:reverse transcriptase [Gossypium australe]